MKGKALRKHSLHEKTAASVLLKLFISSKAPVTLNGVAAAFVQRSKTMSARCGIAKKYA